MSVAGKARHFPNQLELLYDTRKEARLLHALIRDATAHPGTATSRPIGSATVAPTPGRGTSVFTTPIAFNPTTFTIVSAEPDTIRIDQLFGKYTTRIIVLGQGGAADNLEFIIGKDDGQGNIGKAAFAGQILNIEAVSTTPITLIEGTDLALPGGVNFKINGGSNVTIIYDSTLDKWKFLHEALVQRLDELLDVTITTPATGEHLEFNGTQWVNVTDFTLKTPQGADIKNVNSIVDLNLNLIQFSSTAPHLDFVLIGDRTMRWTVNSTIFAEMSDLANPGLKMSQPIYLQSNNIYFDSPAGTRRMLFDGTSSTDLRLPAGEFYRVIVGASQRFGVSDAQISMLTVPIDFEEITIPANPVANHGRFYAKDVGGTHSEPFWLDELGTETNIIGGVSFPIEPPVDDREDTWTGSQNIDLNLTTAHSTKFTLDQDLTITLSNIPPDETQIEFEIELLQDATGGWTVTFPPEVVETITIASAANALTVVTLRVNDGANVHAIATIAGTITGGGGASPLTTKGDIFGFDTADARIPVGTDNQILIADSVQALGVKYALITNPNLASGDFDNITGVGIQTQNFDVGNFNVIEINQLTFKEIGQNIADGLFGITYTANPVNDRHMFVTNSGEVFRIEDGFVDFFAGFFDMTERVSPADPPANQGRFFTKDVGGATRPFFVNSTEPEVDLTLGAGANKQLSNLAATVAINLALVPDGDNSRDLGTATIRWRDLFIDEINIQDDVANTPAGGVTVITADTGGMNLGVASTSGILDVFFGGVSKIQFLEDRIKFNDVGQRHEIRADGNSMNLVVENATDTLEISNAPRAFPIAEFDDFLLKLNTKSTSDTSPYEIIFNFRNNAPEGLTDPNIGNITWEGLNSVDALKTYVQIQAGIDDATSTSEDGFFEVFVAVDGTLNKILNMDAQASALRMGFFGVAPVTRRSPAATSAAIITALEQLGLFV